MLMHCFWINIYLTNPPSPAPTNDSSVCLQTTLSGCAQTTLTALAKRQFGGLERHLCHTLEPGLKVTMRERIFVLKKKIGEPAGTNVSTIITH